MKARQHRLILVVAAVLLLPLGGSASGATAETRVLSLDASGGPANGAVQFADISATGKFVAFGSGASDLIANDTNGSQDIFLRNTVSGGIQRVSIRSDESAIVGNSDQPSISADGKVIAFHSYAQFVTPDNVGTLDIFVRDRTAGKTTRVTKGLGGVQPDGASFAPEISASGRYVTFFSSATNLVSGDTNGTYDVFVYDREKKKVERVSVRSNGDEEIGDSNYPSISRNGRKIVFQSSAALADIDDGDTRDIYVHDRTTDKTTLVSKNSHGYQANESSSLPTISDDGKVIAFGSQATNLAPNDPAQAHERIFARTLKTGKTEVVTTVWDDHDVNGDSYDPHISETGRYVVFESQATNLVPGDTLGEYDVFRYDRVTGKTKRMSVATNGSQGTPTNGAFVARISADGRFGIYISDAEGLVPETTNDAYDLFIHGPMSGNG